MTLNLSVLSQFETTVNEHLTEISWDITMIGEITMLYPEPHPTPLPRPATPTPF